MVNKRIIIAAFVIIFMIILQPAFSQQKEKTPDSAEYKKAEENTGDTTSLKTEIKQKNYYSNTLSVISPDELLGLTPEKAYELMGAPAEVFTMRGEREWQDDAVFYFKNHIYLFWFKNKVWQFRADKRFKGTVLDLKPGMRRKEVALIMGKPFKEEEGSEIYLNPKSITRYETGFPVRMKVFYDSEDSVSDIYVYRGDF